MGFLFSLSQVDVGFMLTYGQLSASSVQALSSIMKGQGTAVQKILGALDAWMIEHKFANLAAFRGKLAGSKDSDPWSYERGQQSRPSWG